MSERRLTPGQKAVLVGLQRRGAYIETNAVSAAAGKPYGPWAYEKLRTLSRQGLVLCQWGDSKKLTTWIISDAGREALAKASA